MKLFNKQSIINGKTKMNRNTIESKQTERMMANWYTQVSGSCELNPDNYGAWDIALRAQDNWLVEVKGLSYTKDKIEHFKSRVSFSRRNIK